MALFDFGWGDKDLNLNTTATIFHIKAVVRLKLHSLGPADQLTRETSLI
jgi:hypothetical protein